MRTGSRSISPIHLLHLAAGSLFLFMGSGCGEVTGSGSSGPGAPALSVSWTHALPCTPGVTSNVEVTLDASDDQDDPASLGYSGSVASCSPSLSGPSNTLSCPQLAPYRSTATVTDSDGLTDTVDFSISPCLDGSAS